MVANAVFIAIGIAAAIVILIGICICAWLAYRNARPPRNAIALKEEDLEPLLMARPTIEKSQEEKKREYNMVQTEKSRKEKQEFELTAKMYLRTTNYKLPSLVEIGVRQKKWYLTTSGTKDLNGSFFMSLVGISTDCKVFDQSEKTINAFMTFFQTVENPYILPIQDVQYQKDKHVFVGFRPNCPTGSLRDFIYNSNPTAPYPTKYRDFGTPIKESKLKKWGREILEALDYFQTQKIPYYQLHTGNVILDNNICRITDYENDLLCLAPQTLKFLSKCPEIPPMVATFGFTLFEMACGFRMDYPTIDTIPSSCNPKVKKILKQIFDAEGNPPTIRQLIKNPFFDVTLYSTWVPKTANIDPRVTKIFQYTDSVLLDYIQGKKKESIAGPKRGTHNPTPKKKPSAYPRSSTQSSSFFQEEKLPTSPRSVPQESSISKQEEKKPEQKKAAPATPASASSSTSTKKSTKKSTKRSTKSNISTSVPAPPEAPPPPPPTRSSEGRGGLLSSIEGFKKGGLKKTKTVVKGVDVGGKIV